MDIITGWVSIGLTALGMVSAVIIALWKFARIVDRNTLIVEQNTNTIKTVWTRVDEHTEQLKNVDGRLIKIETRLDYSKV
jgi:hypothetical protein